MNRTSISWTDFSSNPIYAVDRETGKRGWFCEKLSPSCANCYASALNVRRGTGHDYLPENRDKVEFRLNERELAAILRRRKPARIFMMDMGDLWHGDVPDTFIDRVFATMALAPWHTFLLLTKRPERMREYVSSRTNENERGAAFWSRFVGQDYRPSWPLLNVHLGVSVENQRFADERIPILLDTPAAVHFISAEPLLGPLNLLRWLGRGYNDGETGQFLETGVDWVIVGGESAGSPERRLVERCVQPWHDINMRLAVCDRCAGTGWRPKPKALAWLRSLRGQAAGTAFYFKGWGGPTPKSGGRLLDGREWNEMPGKEA